MLFDVERLDPFVDEEADFWMRVEHCARYLWAADFLSREGCASVADLASGRGYGSAMLARAAETVVGADRDRGSVEDAERRYGRAGVTFCCRDFDHAPLRLPGAPFDAVVCFETLEHVRHPRVLLAGIRDVLRDGGRLLLSVPNDRFERVDENGNNLDPFHLHVFERGEVLGLLGDTGFRVERMLGQDMCNRVVSASSSLLEAGLADEGQVRDLVRVSDPRSLVLAARLLGYPDDVAPDESYSRIYVCKRA